MTPREREFLKKSLIRSIEISKPQMIECILSKYESDTVYLIASFKYNANDDDIDYFRILGSETIADYSTALLDEKIVNSDFIEKISNKEEWIVISDKDITLILKE